MLVVGRKKGESIIIGDDIEVTVVKVDEGTVKLAISAPKDVTILRKELVKEVQEENKKAANVDFTILNKLK
ncbi:carbon storage regulator [Clostridium tetani]|uniref:carbon storage regulator CsrA n=1 Tax=Clostridium tetani TaxID=1513 RepID=UPI0010263821|nr:carbon storage regulator CsrA [Clostridium tetani]RXI73128.1 carbon storage regulator [Clostridium tetani]BDR72895.1 carbon storage regulator [Clostridium tetani]